MRSQSLVMIERKGRKIFGQQRRSKADRVKEENIWSIEEKRHCFVISKLISQKFWRSFRLILCVRGECLWPTLLNFVDHFHFLIHPQFLKYLAYIYPFFWVLATLKPSPRPSPRVQKHLLYSIISSDFRTKLQQLQCWANVWRCREGSSLNGKV